jgi:hypothetical protein
VEVECEIDEDPAIFEGSEGYVQNLISKIQQQYKNPETVHIKITRRQKPDGIDKNGNLIKNKNESYGQIIRKEYYTIKYSFNKFKNGFVYYDYNQLIAFCIWDIKEEYSLSIGKIKKLHIYLICGKKLDYNLVPRILDDVVHLCRKYNIQYITLEPANEELKEYYIKCGFEEYKDALDGSKYFGLDVSKSRIIHHTTPDTIIRKRINKTRKYRK